jgi:hypothetical protein
MSVCRDDRLTAGRCFLLLRPIWNRTYDVKSGCRLNPRRTQFGRGFLDRVLDRRLVGMSLLVSMVICLTFNLWPNSHAAEDLLTSEVALIG